MPCKTFVSTLEKTSQEKPLTVTHDDKINAWEEEFKDKIEIISRHFSITSYSGITIDVGAIHQDTNVALATEIFYQKK